MGKLGLAKKEKTLSGAADIREISISEFFSKNRHLLGFDNPGKSILTTVREGVDNSLDACEEAGILPEIIIRIEQSSENRFIVAIEDNGPGISKEHLPNIFAKLLYGSKFHRLKQSRGQQGIGISAAVMYGQMTTGKAAEVVSKLPRAKSVSRVKLHIDTKKNMPKIVSEKVFDDDHWRDKKSGTLISIEMEGAYSEGRYGVLSYIRRTAMSNSHAQITLIDPKNLSHHFPRLTDIVPIAAKEILPHPHGIELGTLIQILADSRRKSVSKMLTEEFCRVSEANAIQICKAAKISPTMTATSAGRNEAESLFKAIQETKLLPPPTNCLSPMGEDSMLKALHWLFYESKNLDQADLVSEPAEKNQGAFDFQKLSKGSSAIQKSTQLVAEDGVVLSEENGYFVTAVTRSPAVYRGNPFQVEVGLFYGKDLKSDGLAQVYRFANRVPLQYQASACAMTKSVMSASWKSYGLQQSKGALPSGPVVIVVHIASVWVPYTSESKEAIAHYPEILKEFKLALMEAGRRLSRYLKRKHRQADEAKKRGYIEKYLNPIGDALEEILEFSPAEKASTLEKLEKILERSRDKGSKSKENNS